MHCDRLLAAILLFLSAAGAEAQIEVREAKLDTGRYKEMAAELKESAVLEEFAQEINAWIRLPAAVGVRFAECGEANAYYDPEPREIWMCFELLDDYYESMEESYDSDDELDAAVWNAFTVILFHELGHALIDVLDLPVTGREEDAVDQLAAWSLIDNAEGDDAVLDAALSYYVSAEQSGNEFYDSDFADEHSLDPQRYYNLVCWVYGSDPDKHAALISEEWLPKERAARCPGEYEQIDKAWSRLLADAEK